MYPWCSDGPSEAELGGTLETTLSAWADACHAQGGTVILPHFPNPNGEPAALIATGRADAVEMIRCTPYNHLEYYRYLNAGYRLPLVGGTDKMSQRGRGRAVPHLRPHSRGRGVHLRQLVPQPALGRTFLSGGPLLGFSVDGAQIGDTLRLPAGGGTVEVERHGRSICPIHTLQIVQDGQVVGRRPTSRAGRAS